MGTDEHHFICITEWQYNLFGTWEQYDNNIEMSTYAITSRISADLSAANDKFICCICNKRRQLKYAIDIQSTFLPNAQLMRQKIS